jgi:hypothetical protein
MMFKMGIITPHKFICSRIAFFQEGSKAETIFKALFFKE